jgi:hypothetical protein
VIGAVDAMGMDVDKGASAENGVASTSVPGSEAVDASKNMPTSQVSAFGANGENAITRPQQSCMLSLTHPCTLALF